MTEPPHSSSADEDEDDEDEDPEVSWLYPDIHIYHIVISVYAEDLSHAFSVKCINLVFCLF